MGTHSGRRVAWLVGAFGLVVLAVTGLALRDTLREAYHIYRLEHGDEKSQEASAAILGTMRSLKAVPVLIEKVYSAAQWPPDLPGGHPDLAWTSTGETILAYQPPERTYLFQRALIDIGPDALPALLASLFTDDPIVGCLHAETLFAIVSEMPGLGPFVTPEYFGPEEILPVLAALKGDKLQSRDVREKAAYAHRRILASTPESSR